MADGFRYLVLAYCLVSSNAAIKTEKGSRRPKSLGTQYHLNARFVRHSGTISAKTTDSVGWDQF